MMMNKNVKLELEDMRMYDSQIYNSLKHISEKELTQEELDALQINFQVELLDK